MAEVSVPIVPANSDVIAAGDGFNIFETVNAIVLTIDSAAKAPTITN